MTEVTEPTFANHFWGPKDDGYYVLTAKMNNNKKTYDEIKAFYNIRASLHEEFGRKLMKHAKTSIGREELGTLHTLLKSAHEEMERNAQTHIDLGHKLKSVLEVYLDNFILEQKDKKKLTQTSVEKAHRYKQSSESYLAKVKEKYESDCAKLITLQTQMGSVSGREVDRIKQKIEKTQQDIKIQEQEYRTACKKLADATNAWNETWKAACDSYQVMEKQRLEFLHHSFSMYINILSTATHEDQESYERFWKSLDNYDPGKDIKTFISDKGTGSNIPEAEVFIDYMDDPSKAFPQYKTANFPVPSELIFSPSLNNNLRYSKTYQEKESNNATTMNEIISNFPTPPNHTSRLEREKTTGAVPKPLPNILFKQKPHTDSIASCLTEVQPPSRHQSQEKHLVELPDQEPYPIQRQFTLSQVNSPCSQPPSPEHQTSMFQQPYPLQSPVSHLQQFSPSLHHQNLGNYSLQQGQSSRFQNSHYQQEKHSLLEHRTWKQQPMLQKQRSIQQQKPVLEQLPSPVVVTKDHQQQKHDVFNASSPQQETIPIVTPTTSPLPDMETSSSVITDDTSDEEQHAPKGDRDAEIDPCANIVLAIGKNMFNLGNLLQDEKSGRRRRRSSADLEAACNFSYQGLLEEIGVYKKEEQQSVVARPPTIKSTRQPILFWGLTLTDWHSGKPEDLQFSKGTWLAVIEEKQNGWYYAIRFDSRLNQLTNETGFVASSIVKAFP